MQINVIPYLRLVEEGLATSNIPSHDQDLEQKDAEVKEAQRQQAE